MNTYQPRGRGLTRNRERLACIECRRRKLKCDRQQPCGACNKRKDSQNCLFQKFADDPYTPPSSNGNGVVRSTPLEARLAHLEELVQRMAPRHALEEVVEQNGTPTLGSRLSTGSNGMVNGATHWGSVWNDIQELRLAMADDTEPKPDLAPENVQSYAEIVFGSTNPMTMENILAQFLPPRQEVDRHVSGYFKAQIISAATCIHSKQFQRQYRRFWEDPMGVSPLWVSMLFSMCDAVRNSGAVKVGNGHDERYPLGAAHCLVLGQYFRPQPWAPEALLMFAQVRCLNNPVLSPDVSPLFAVAFRVATAMGYHRKPETLKLTPFDAEMRRRTWTLLTQMDLLTSFHLGLPPCSPVPAGTVEPLSNLNDSGFDEGDVRLPEPRPLEEPTTSQFIVAKQQFMVIFDKILRAALESQHNLVPLEQLHHLHSEIELVFESIPADLKPRSMKDSVFDSSSLLVTRLCVLFIYAKSVCVLHRPYVLLRRVESIEACYRASTMLTDGLCDAYFEFTPGGQAKSETWFLSALTWHDFLLGTVALCLSALVGQSCELSSIVDLEATCELLSRITVVLQARNDMVGVGTSRVLQIVGATIERLRDGGFQPERRSLDRDLGAAIDGGWIQSMPEPMEDALWDEYMGQYLDLDRLLSS